VGHAIYALCHLLSRCDPRRRSSIKKQPMKDLRCDHKLWRHFRHHVPQLIQVGLRERPHVSFEGSQSADKTCLPAERKVHFRGRVSQRLIGYRSMEAGAVDLHEQGAFGSDYGLRESKVVLICQWKSSIQGDPFRNSSRIVTRV